MIVWFLTVIFAVACWGFATYRVHTNFFNFIEYFGSKEARDSYGDLKQKSWNILIACIVTLVLCLVPAINVITGLILVGGTYAFPAGLKAWEYLKTVGK